MNHVDFNRNKFYIDAYGNLYPRCRNTCRAPQHVIDSVEQDTEIMEKYGLE